jgi:clan AA aspartic protease
MGLVHAEITLKNYGDVSDAKKNRISENEIRQLTVQVLVDSGAWTMVINEETREKLGLEITRTSQGTLANGAQEEYNLAGPLEIWWKDRSIICEALVVPTAEENLLGAIPLEAMDLTINPRNQALVGIHGDQIVHSVK